MNMEQLVEWELARKTKVRRENQPQSHFAQKSCMIYLGSNPGMDMGLDNE
jgi:hypothetical protein